MCQHKPIDKTFCFATTTMCALVMGITFAAVGGSECCPVQEPGAYEDQTEILKITVGEPTKLSDAVMQNMSTVMVSRTGVAGVMYRKPGTEPRYPKHTRRGSAMGYRVSTDGGLTWGKEMSAPDAFGGGQESGTLPDGGVIIPATDPRPSTAYTRAEGWKGETDPDPAATRKTGWYDVRFLRFTDDMMNWQEETVAIYMPNAGPPSLDVKYPGMSKGKMVQLPNGDMLAPMYGGFKGDREDIHRAIVVRSKNQGRTWKYYASIAYEPVDPHPELPGQYCSATEPSITLLPNGKMVAMLRSQYSHLPGEYKPMAVCWSDDLGKTWTKPQATKPHLMNISPTLAALDNGVVACQYGRPGFHVAFSLDDGHTWQDRVSLSDLPVGVITGQFDMVKVGPNELITVGNDAEGTKVWPISVQRTTVSAKYIAQSGRVIDENGHPIAGAIVERSPNRYTADDWLEDPTTLGLYGTPMTVGSPELSYRSIRKENGHPTVKTDSKGRFHMILRDNTNFAGDADGDGDVDGNDFLLRQNNFKPSKPGEYVLTVEADGYAPQHRHIKIGPNAQPQEFRLKPGRRIRNRVVDQSGQPIAGACIVLNKWHIHTDPTGSFHWSVEAPQPEQVAIKVYKRYSDDYETLKATVSLSQLESEPITLKHR